MQGTKRRVREMKMPTSEPRTMTIDEFAEMAGVSRNLAYRLAKENRLGVPVIRLGRRLLLSRTRVTALLEESKE